MNLTNYRTIHGMEAWYHGQEAIGLKVEADISRDLTDNELSIIRRDMEAWQNMIRKNTLLQDKEYMADVRKERIDLLACFGDNKIYATEITNEYDPNSIRPWFWICTSKGPIKIGWRKRVIVIDWSGSDVTSPAEGLFPGEQTTKYDKLIHAWGYDKAKEYIETILCGQPVEKW